MPEDPVRDDGVTMPCAHCGIPFRAQGRRRYCSNACRQRSFRARRSVPELPPLLRAPSAGTVYICPACDARYLGIQRCEDCGTFCRRLGAGGLCPCCDEPVALKDLLGEGVTIVSTD